MSDKIEQSDYKHGTPPDGWECLATMDEITTADGNYGTSECVRCLIAPVSFSNKSNNIVEYQSFPSLQWQPAKFEESTIEELLNHQFHNYLEKVKTTDCQAELRRLLKTGPPIYIFDKHALPLYSDDDTHVCKLWFQRDNIETSAKLDGAVEGEEREKLWEELRSFIILQGKEEGDDDDNKE
jgi:hypothetical protein